MPSPMQGYYDYAPSRLLERPLVITGFMGSNAEQVAYMLSARTGVTYESLERSVEHRAGKSIANLVIHQGECSLRALEEELLRRALERKPAPIISLGHGALLSPKNAAAVREHATLVYLRAPLGDLFETIKSQAALSKVRYYPYATDLTGSPADLEELFAARLPGYMAADHVVDVANTPPQTVARRLSELLDLELDMSQFSA